jgi:hypothetical protein
MEKGSPGLRISRLMFGTLFTALGIWISARIVLQLQGANAPWPDWLSLLFPSVPLAVGILAFVAAIRNYPDPRQPFLRHRKGPARIFGSVTGGVFLTGIILQHLFQQKTLGGVLKELVAATILVGLSALLFSSINADVADQQRSGK